jgi:predicted ArsR family transcriptional regulator
VAAHALAHPTRRRIAEELGATPDGLSVAELSAATGLHHNAVREHLRTLAAAGVVASEQDAPQGRGRPTTRYSLVDEEAPRIAAHQELVRLLVGLLRDVGADEAQAERYGVGHGGAMADPGGRDALMAAFARSGFAPREISSAADARAGTLELRLEHCPFREAVLSPGGELVCALHRGLATGMAGVASPGARLTDFVPKDPRPAGCRVRVEGLSPPE